MRTFFAKFEIQAYPKANELFMISPHAASSSPVGCCKYENGWLFDAPEGRLGGGLTPPFSCNIAIHLR